MGLLEGKVAVITGSGRGIGQAMAQLFAEEGASIMVTDIDEGPARETCDTIRSAGGKAAMCVGSVAKQQDADRLLGSAAETFGHVDILVNNAGITRDAVIHKIKDDEWNLVLDVCLRGTFHCVRASVPYMREVAKKELQEGNLQTRKIINVSSVAGIGGNAGQINYASAKAAIVGLTKSVAKEWAQFRICSNAIAPGFIETRLTASKKEGDPLGIPEEQRSLMMLPQLLPFGPGKPQDVAKVALFLASPLSDYVTGQVIVVAGGLMGY